MLAGFGASCKALRTMHDIAPTHRIPPPFASGRPAGVSARALLVLAVLGTLGGCKLVDQRSFDARADRKPVPHVPPPPPGRPLAPPLALVRFGAGPGDWQPGLSAIVRQALARKPLALFRVETVVPAHGTPQAQAVRLADAAGQDGRMVADTIVAAGASSAQVEMTASSDAAVTQPEVRVTVR